MTPERKSIMISGRLPPAVVSRVDFIVRNIDNDAVRNRSAALLAALEAWLPGQEDRLRELGILAKKTR